MVYTNPFIIFPINDFVFEEFIYIYTHICIHVFMIFHSHDTYDWVFLLNLVQVWAFSYKEPFGFMYFFNMKCALILAYTLLCSTKRC